LFTSERRADGQSDLYSIKPDGIGLETLVETDSFEDSGSLSPDGSKLAYIPTAMNYTTNVFVKDLPTGATYNVTGSDESVINFVGPHSFFRPSWSPDGTKVVYEVYEWVQRPAEMPLFSWHNEWEYRFMDVFPQFNEATKRLATTEKQLGNASSSVVITDAGYDNLVRAFDIYDMSSTDAEKDAYASGLAGAFQPTWSNDGSKLIVGFGTWLFNRGNTRQTCICSTPRALETTKR
jgi:Tol biopolymer transport system component